jgi:hypothetical protein
MDAVKVVEMGRIPDETWLTLNRRNPKDVVISSQ